MEEEPSSLYPSFPIQRRSSSLRPYTPGGLPEDASPVPPADEYRYTQAGDGYGDNSGYFKKIHPGNAATSKRPRAPESPTEVSLDPATTRLQWGAGRARYFDPSLAASHGRISSEEMPIASAQESEATLAAAVALNWVRLNPNLTKPLHETVGLAVTESTRQRNLAHPLDMPLSYREVLVAFRDELARLLPLFEHNLDPAVAAARTAQARAFSRTCQPQGARYAKAPPPMGERFDNYLEAEAGRQHALATTIMGSCGMAKGTRITGLDYEPKLYALLKQIYEAAELLLQPTVPTGGRWRAPVPSFW